MTKKMHVLRSPYARFAMAQAMAFAAIQAAAPAVVVERETLETVPPPAPPQPPKSQRLRMIDDDGLKYLNESRAKRAARNAKRAENYRRGIEGQRR